ncbi:MAG: amino acid racemase [Armatimonadota bacterium]
MNRIGLIGGTSYVATADYYKGLNEVIYARTKTEFADVVIFSLNFGPIERNIQTGNIQANAPAFIEAARALQAAGCQVLAFAANTSHLFTEEVKTATGLPLVHIGEATAEVAVAKGFKKVGLLGTRYTMEGAFIRSKLEERGLTVVIPGSEDRTFVNDSIFGELTRDIFTDPTRGRYQEIIARLAEEGCDSVALACTEIPLLLEGHSSPLPTLETTRIHVEAIAEAMLA